MGDDDSGPEDAVDDLDLECVAYIWLSIKCALRAHHRTQEIKLFRKPK